MAVETRPWTRAELARLPEDGNRYEVLDGRLLVTPQASPPHQQVAIRLAMALEQHVAPSRAAHVVGPGAVPFGDNELQPDVQVIPGRPGPERWEDLPRPILVVEVLSDSSRRYDLGIKLRAYRERLGIPVVWIVDHRRREVHVHEGGREPHIERDALEWHASGAPGEFTPLRIDLPALFKEALGE